MNIRVWTFVVVIGSTCRRLPALKIAEYEVHENHDANDCKCKYIFAFEFGFSVDIQSSFFCVFEYFRNPRAHTNCSAIIKLHVEKPTQMMNDFLFSLFL